MSDVGFSSLWRQSATPTVERHVGPAEHDRGPPSPSTTSHQTGPSTVVQPFDIVLRKFTAKEQKILDEVDRGQGSLPTVENLEDHLGIVVVIKIDNNQLKEAGEGIRQGRQPLRIDLASSLV